MSHQLDQIFSNWCEEFRRKNIHLIPYEQQQNKTTTSTPASAQSAGQIASGKQSSSSAQSATPKWEKDSRKTLSLWARAWLNVAKGIIG